MEVKEFYSENENTTATVVNITKWTFPSLRINGQWYRLDGSQKMAHSRYYVYDNGDGRELCPEEHDYNTRFMELFQQHQIEKDYLLQDTKEKTERITQLEDELKLIKGSIFEYIKFRFKG